MPDESVRTVADCFTRDRRSEAPAIVVDGRSFDYHWTCTTAWKAGNLLRHDGVRRGVRVGIVTDRSPFDLLAFFGSTLLGATTWFDPPRTLQGSDVRAIVAPTDEVESFDVSPDIRRIGYGARPSDPRTRHFEAECWRENPSFPPVDRDPETAVLFDGERTYTHTEVVGGARRAAATLSLAEDDLVALDASLADPRVVAGGLLAPLLVGGTVALTWEADDPPVTAAVTDDPESWPLDRVVAPDDVRL